MSSDLGPEPHELQEQVVEALKEVREELDKEKTEHDRDRQWIGLIGLSTALLSALAAATAMEAGFLANESLLAQIRSTDQWSYFQAKSTKRHVEEATVTILQVLNKPVPSKTTSELKKLAQEQNQIQAEAQKLENEAQENLRKHEWLARSVTTLQIAISLGAVAALLRRKSVWYVGLGISVVGLAFLGVGLLPSHSNIKTQNSNHEISLNSPQSRELLH